ncbi:hypothetical protein [Ponticoccus litoralis]|uniref:Uncharacterized protein n=1 Tax=Ponticoccus litoralis TaxID=422297 RepID=A0AAW9SCH1_9RHOB
MSIPAHSSTSEALRHVQAARRKRRVQEGMRLAQNVATLSDWPGKTTTEASEKKGK